MSIHEYSQLSNTLIESIHYSYALQFIHVYLITQILETITTHQILDKMMDQILITHGKWRISTCKLNSKLSIPSLVVIGADVAVVQHQIFELLYGLAAVQHQ